MNYFTEFSIGLTNAWIGSLIIFISMIATASNKELAKRMMDVSWYTAREKKLMLPSFIFQFGFLLLCVWVPLKIGTVWFYGGTTLFCLGFIGNVTATHNYATTPKDEAIRKGMFKISRNPLYFCYTVMTLGLVIASLSLPLFIIWIAHTAVTHMLILGEERYCLDTYAQTYKEYMEKVPRYILFF